MTNEIPEDPTSYQCKQCTGGTVSLNLGGFAWECDTCDFISYDVDMDSDLWGMII